MCPTIKRIMSEYLRGFVQVVLLVRIKLIVQEEINSIKFDRYTKMVIMLDMKNQVDSVNIYFIFNGLSKFKFS